MNFKDQRAAFEAEMRRTRDTPPSKELLREQRYRWKNEYYNKILETRGRGGELTIKEINDLYDHSPSKASRALDIRLRDDKTPGAAEIRWRSQEIEKEELRRDYEHSESRMDVPHPSQYIRADFAQAIAQARERLSPAQRMRSQPEVVIQQAAQEAAAAPQAPILSDHQRLVIRRKKARAAIVAEQEAKDAEYAAFTADWKLKAEAHRIWQLTPEGQADTIARETRDKERKRVAKEKEEAKKKALDDRHEKMRQDEKKRVRAAGIAYGKKKHEKKVADANREKERQARLEYERKEYQKKKKKK